MEYIFTDNDYRFVFKGQRTYKILVVLFMERFKKLFHNHSEAGRLISKLERMRTDKDNASDDEEGFFGSSEEEDKHDNSSIFLKNAKYADLLKEPGYRPEKVMRILQEKDE